MAGGRFSYQVNLVTGKAEKNAKKLTKTLDKQGKQAKKTGGAFSSMAAKIGGMAVAYLGLSKGISLVTNLWKEAWNLAKEQIKVEGQLALKYGESADALFRQASALQKVTTFGDEMTIGGQALLSFYNLELESVKALTPTMLDMAAAGIQVKTASELMGKAMKGEFGTFSRYGILISDVQKEILKTGTESEKTAVLIGVLQAKFGGLAEELASTSAGAWEQYKNAVSDAKERIGLAIQASEELEKSIRSTTKAVEESFQDTRGLTKFIDLVILGGRAIADFVEWEWIPTSELESLMNTLIKIGVLEAPGAAQALEIAELKMRLDLKLSDYELELLARNTETSKKAADEVFEHKKALTDAESLDVLKRMDKALDEQAKLNEQLGKELTQSELIRLDEMKEAKEKAAREQADIQAQLDKGIAGTNLATLEVIKEKNIELIEAIKTLDKTRTEEKRETALETAELQKILDKEVADNLSELDRQLAANKREAIRVFGEEAVTNETALKEQKTLNIEELSALQDAALVEGAEKHMELIAEILDSQKSQQDDLNKFTSSGMQKVGEDFSGAMSDALGAVQLDVIAAWGYAAMGAIDLSNLMNPLLAKSEQFKRNMQESMQPAAGWWGAGEFFPGQAEPTVPMFGGQIPGESAFHKGGMITAHSGLFLRQDEVAIRAQRGEGVLSRRGMAALGGESALNALNAPGGAVRNEINVSGITVIAGPGQSPGQIADAVFEKLMDETRRGIKKLNYRGIEDTPPSWPA